MPVRDNGAKFSSIATLTLPLPEPKQGKSRDQREGLEVHAEENGSFSSMHPSKTLGSMLFLGPVSQLLAELDNDMPLINAYYTTHSNVQSRGTSLSLERVLRTSG